MEETDISNFNLSGLTTFRYVMLRQAEYYEKVEPDEEKSAWYRGQAERAKIAIAERYPQAAGAAGNSDAGQVEGEG